MTNGTKVLIADDHPVIRQGLRAVLGTAQDLEVVGEAEDGEKAVELARELQPDVVVMDVAMPVCGGERATREIKRLQLECKVLALSTYKDDESMRQMLEAGAAGYVTKQSAPEQLIYGIRSIRAGKEPFFSSDIAATALRLQQGRSDQEKSFTPVESKVLKRIAAGITTKMMAEQLNLSEWEVKNSRERIMDKLKVRNIAELTRYAVANGFLPLERGPGPETNDATSAQVRAWASSSNGICVVEEPSLKNLSKAIETSVCAGDDLSFELRCGLLALQHGKPHVEVATNRPGITRREREVIIALAEGLSNKETAARLLVGVRTVETHRENLMRKLKVKNVAGITRFALAQGWIPNPVENRGGLRLGRGVDPISTALANNETNPRKEFTGRMPERAVILIVEDNEVDLLFVRRAFAKAKVLNPLFSLQTGEEAISYLKGEGRYANRGEFPLPSLVLLDLKLTGINGFQVLKWIREQPGLKALRVVVLTGCTAIEEINLAYQLGANSFLAKPLDFESFVQVAAALAGYWIWMSETPEVSRPEDPEARICSSAAKLSS